MEQVPAHRTRPHMTATETLQLPFCITQHTNYMVCVENAAKRICKSYEPEVENEYDSPL